MSGRRRVEVDGEVAEPGDASVERVEPGVYSVLVNGRSVEVCVNGGDAAWIGPRALKVAVSDPRDDAVEPSEASGAGRIDVRAPMPGKVIRLLVTEGQHVTAGQGLLVVEAMKMQNEMLSPKEGTVVALRAAPGDAVATGQVLASVE